MADHEFDDDPLFDQLMMSMDPAQLAQLEQQLSQYDQQAAAIGGISGANVPLAINQQPAINPHHQIPMNQNHHDESAMAAMRRELAQLQTELADVRQERQQLATETLGRAGEVRIVRQKLDKVRAIYFYLWFIMKLICDFTYRKNRPSRRTSN